jgi:hypothetical protein
MTTAKIIDLQARIAKAQSDLGTWRTGGMQERYLEAYVRAEALELQLDAVRREAHESPAGALASTPLTDAPGGPDRLMAELSITYNGRQYEYGGHTYDLLTDAVNYARLQPPLPGFGGAAPMRTARPVEVPTDAQRELMGQWDITFSEGVYHYAAYRYDRLADAVNYARLQRR